MRQNESILRAVLWALIVGALVVPPIVVLAVVFGSWPPGPPGSHSSYQGFIVVGILYIVCVGVLVRWWRSQRRASGRP